MRIINADNYLFNQIIRLIDNGNINEVIEYAKKENVLGERINTGQRAITQRIKERLDREGLSHDIIRPE